LLSHREEQVAWLAAQGGTNRAIAVQLDISVRTVEGHMAKVLGTLGIHSRRDLVRIFTPPELSSDEALAVSSDNGGAEGAQPDVAVDRSRSVVSELSRDREVGLVAADLRS
jgi:DNA-binding CsgD family transcriptional regulator